MTGEPDLARSGVTYPCPECGGRLGEPVNRGVHCFVTCAACGEEYQLDDVRLAGPPTSGPPAPCD